MKDLKNGKYMVSAQIYMVLDRQQNAKTKGFASIWPGVMAPDSQN